MSSEQPETPVTDENETYVPILQRIYFNGGRVTPEKLRKLAVDIMSSDGEPSRLALLSGCAVGFLIECAQILEKNDGDLR